MTEASADLVSLAKEEASPPERGSPGEQLRVAREAQQMSVADVAEVLRFSERQIEALEAGDYGSLPGATVVRGFIRAYAKLLKLDPAPLIAALADQVPAGSVEVRPPANMGQAESAPLLGAAVPWRKVTGGLVVLAGLLAGGYYLTITLPLEQSAPQGTVAQVAAPTVTPPMPVLETAPGNGGTATAAAPASAPVSAPPPANALILEFDDTSWVEIRDAAKKVLLSGEFPKGTRQSVDGRPPLQLWIGKASVVRVHFGERTVDLKPHTHEDVARLSVE